MNTNQVSTYTFPRLQFIKMLCNCIDWTKHKIRNEKFKRDNRSTEYIARLEADIIRIDKDIEYLISLPNETITIQSNE